MSQSFGNNQQGGTGGAQGAASQTGGASSGGSQNFGNSQSGGSAQGGQRSGAAGQGGSQGGQGVGDVKQEVKQQAQHVVSDVKEHAQQIASEVTAAASDAAGQAKRQSVQMLEKQKRQAAEHLAGFQHAIESASNRLREEENANLAEYADAAAAKLRQLRTYLDNRDLQDLMHDAEDFARKRPEVVFGGLAIAGLAVARFLKASSRSRRMAAYNDYGSPDYRPGVGANYSGGYSGLNTGTDYTSGVGQYGSTASGGDYRPLQDTPANSSTVGGNRPSTSVGTRPQYGNQASGTGHSNNR